MAIDVARRNDSVGTFAPSVRSVDERPLSANGKSAPIDAALGGPKTIERRCEQYSSWDVHRQTMPREFFCRNGRRHKRKYTGTIARANAGRVFLNPNTITTMATIVLATMVLTKELIISASDAIELGAGPDSYRRKLIANDHDTKCLGPCESDLLLPLESGGAGIVTDRYQGSRLRRRRNSVQADAPERVVMANRRAHVNSAKQQEQVFDESVRFVQHKTTTTTAPELSSSSLRNETPPETTTPPAWDYSVTKLSERSERSTTRELTRVTPVGAVSSSSFDINVDHVASLSRLEAKPLLANSTQSIMAQTTLKPVVVRLSSSSSSFNPPRQFDRGSNQTVLTNDGYKAPPSAKRAMYGGAFGGAAGIAAFQDTGPAGGTIKKAKKLMKKVGRKAKKKLKKRLHKTKHKAHHQAHQVAHVGYHG